MSTVVGPPVTVLSLGGTIAGAASGSGAVAPALGAGDLVAAVPGIGAIAEVTARSVALLPSAHLTIEDVVALAEVVDDAHRSGAAGVVVAQGTDTLEDTAFLLDLLVGAPEPVVVTGAMRNPTLAGADGAANLLAAVSVAADPAARGVGTLVVLNDEIHAARFVSKRHPSNPAAFRSDPGPLGWVTEGRPRLVVRPVGRCRLPRPAPESRHRVALVVLPIGDDGSLAEAAADRGADGVVVEALGGGHAPAAAVERLGAVARRVPVVLTSTTRAGEALRSTYGSVGSERDLADRGLVNGGRLDARKARLLLTMLLRSGADRGRIAAVFADPWADPVVG